MPFWTKFYVLAGKAVVSVDAQTHAAFWAGEDPGRVGLDEIGDVEVSTVFLTRPAGFDPGGAPLLFETSLFGSRGAIGVLRRYVDWSTARAGHVAAVSELQRSKAN